MKKKPYSLLIALLFSLPIVAQQRTFTGVFINREGLLEIVSMFNAQGNYALEIIKSGERIQAEAKDIGGGNLEGIMPRGKEKIPFNINYEKGFYFFVAENASVPLTQHVEEYNKVERKALKKNYTDHRFATGARVFDAEGTFAFNLPTDEWTYQADEGVFSLQKEDLMGWIKIYPHQIPTLEEAKQPEAVAAFIAGGHFEEAILPSPYGKLSFTRHYKGTDPQGRQMRFLILSVVSPEGGGLHIIAGAPAGKYEGSYERNAKVIADSVEFIH